MTSIAFATPALLSVPFRRPTTHTCTCHLAVVAGATGGVGRLVIDRLLAATIASSDDIDPSSRPALPITTIRALVRDEQRARSILPISNSNLSLYQLSTSPSSSSSDDLKNALKGAAALIVCTGTTAFPTRAWRGGNTPKYIDDQFVHSLTTAVDTQHIQRVVLASSIGTGNPSRFPFVILNLFGVLDAKKRGEQHVRTNAERLGHAYSIVRVGRLVGEPQTNVGMLRTEPDPNWKDIVVARGDNVAGDLSRETAADAIVFATRWTLKKNLDFSVVHALGCSPPAAKWERMLQSVES